MKHKCIKTDSVWWGIVYQEGNIYESSESKNKQLTYVFDHEKYDALTAELMSYANIMIKAGGKYNQDQSKFPKEVKDIFDEYGPKSKAISEEMQKYTKTIELPFVYIEGEMDNASNDFCILSKQEVAKMCNFDNYEDVKFSTTTYFLEDFFENL